MTENCLYGRTQKVVLDGFSSTSRATNSGVTQGSVLGHFLFLLYINDISANLTNPVRIFTDEIVNDDIVNSANSIINDYGKYTSDLIDGQLNSIPSK